MFTKERYKYALTWLECIWNGKKRSFLVETYSEKHPTTSSFYPSKGLKKKVSHYTSYIYHLWCTKKTKGE